MTLSDKIEHGIERIQVPYVKEFIKELKDLTSNLEPKKEWSEDKSFGFGVGLTILRKRIDKLAGDKLVTYEDFTAPKTNWKKYSNLDNFELLEEGERLDEHLTKINPGLHVMAKWIKYKFNGFFGTYKVMEDGPSSIKRAREKIVKEEERIKESLKK